MERLNFLPRVKTRPVWLHWTQNNSIQDYTDGTVENRLGRSMTGDREIRSDC